MLISRPIAPHFGDYMLHYICNHRLNSIPFAQKGMTALHCCSIEGHDHLITALICKGADIDLGDKVCGLSSRI